MRLLLIRHAETPSNVLGLLDSRVPGPNLTERGRRQATAIPSALAEYPVTSITVSSMVRTSETAMPLAIDRGLDIRVDERLREIEAGAMEMASGREAMTRYVGIAWAWARGELEPRMPGAQDGHEFFERFDGAVDQIEAAGDAAPVIVSHGASIRVWVGNRCRNVSDDFAAESDLHNTGSALVERTDSGAWELVEWRGSPLGGAESPAPNTPAVDDGPGIDDPPGH